MSKIAFVYSRTSLNSARMKYMPFGLNTLILLAERKNIEIDFYVTETKDSAYEFFLPKNIHVIYLDYFRTWNTGQGKSLYYLLNIYFWWISHGKKYQEVWGNGQSGNVLASKLSKRNKAVLFLLNDEFPNISYLRVWREAEKKAINKADVILEPDEARFNILNKQLAGMLNGKKNYTLPNIPLKTSLSKVNKKRNFKVELNIPADCPIFMYAGGIDEENNIRCLLTVFPFSSNDTHLIMVGKGKKITADKKYTHKRIHWIEEVLSDNDLHALIEQSTATIAYYADILDLEYVGKSSGKIMRSLLFNTPVISSKFLSLQFIEEDGMGILIDKPYELIDAFEKIKSQQLQMKINIKKNISKYYFENYWKEFATNELNN